MGFLVVGEGVVAGDGEEEWRDTDRQGDFAGGGVFGFEEEFMFVPGDTPAGSRPPGTLRESRPPSSSIGRPEFAEPCKLESRSVFRRLYYLDVRLPSRAL